MAVANTLAYYDTATINAVKRAQMAISKNFFFLLSDSGKE
jgi:hypothetical protein